MNSKTILRRTMPLIIALAIIILIAISCTVFKRTKKVPAIEKPEEVFLTVGDIKITNGQIYNELKFSNSGIATLVDMIDRDLLKSALNSQGVNFLDAVTAEEIAKQREKILRKDLKLTETAEITEEMDKAWVSNQYVDGGLRTPEDINNALRLQIAKYAYARAQIATDEKAVKDTDISTYYQNNYKDSYWTLVIKYNNTTEATNALNQLGIIIEKVKVSETSTSTIDKWVWAEDKTELTHEEIKQAHIDLYNNAYSYEAPGYPNNENPTLNIILGSDQYTVADEKIVFNTTLDEDENSKKNLFYYTTERLDKISSSLTTAIRGLNDEPTADNTSKLEKTYFVNPKSAGSNYFFAYRMKSVKSVELYDNDGKVINETLRNEIYNIVLDTLVTDTAISEKMAVLRKDLIIYDEHLEKGYISAYDKGFKATKKASVVNVASIGEKVYTADDLYAELSNLFGVTSGYTNYLRELLLNDPKYNTIYDIKNETVLDEKKWKEIDEEVDNIKRSFANGSFGVDSSYGWDNFLRDYNNVDGEKGLVIDLVYDRAYKKFTEEIVETTQEKYDEIYLPNMQKQYDEYLSATGMHLLIHKLDDEGNPIDPEKWSSYDRTQAKELYDLVLTKIKGVRPNRIKTVLETEIINAYNEAPRFLANKEQILGNQPIYSETTKWVDLDPEDYEYSIYKTAGLVIKFESLSTTAGVMVKPFEDAVRLIWDEAAVKDEFGEDIVIYDKTYNNGEYLETEFGFHVYVNLSTTNRPNTTKTVSGKDETTVYQIPSYKDILVYEERPLEEEKDRELTAIEESQVKTYYSSIRAEIAGQNYLNVKMSEFLLTKLEQINYAEASYKDVYKGILDRKIESNFEVLKYITKD